MDAKVLVSMIQEEFKLLGYKGATPTAVARLAAALAAQEIDFGEVGVTAACVGYLIAKRAL